MPRKPQRRTRFQISYNLLKTNRSRFDFRPYVTGGKVKSSGRQIREIEFHLEGIVDGLTCLFSNWGIDIFYVADGEEWDPIWAFHLSDDRRWRRDDGYRERFWIDGCFEPFLLWCNTTLASSSHVELLEMSYKNIKAAQLSGRVTAEREWKPLQKRFDSYFVMFKQLNLSVQYKDVFIPVRK